MNQKIYIGYHSTNNINDGYMGSGKLIKRAILKYGIENFQKDILFIFDNKKEAELKESEIVNSEFCLREDTYNIAIGGNVRAYPGENNPMFGISHPPELIKKIQESRNKTISDRGYTRKTKYDCIIKGIRYYSSSTAKDAIGISRDKNLILYCGNPYTDSYFIDQDFQKEAEESYRQNEIRKIEMAKLNSERARLRFKGKPKSEETKRKISDASRGKSRPWVSEKINKNPEKIRKTAEAHTGMTRSPEAKKNMSIAQQERKQNEEIFKE